MAQGGQDLVPRNLPYGGRQDYVASAQAAGVPISSRSRATGRRPPAKRGAGPGGEELIRPDLDVFDYASPADIPGVDVSPQGRQMRLEQEMAALATGSPNPLVRGIATTWLRRRRVNQGMAP
jgi:hypothetical protein